MRTNMKQRQRHSVFICRESNDWCHWYPTAQVNIARDCQKKNKKNVFGSNIDQPSVGVIPLIDSIGINANIKRDFYQVE